MAWRLARMWLEGQESNLPTTADEAVELPELIPPRLVTRASRWCHRATKTKREILVAYSLWLGWDLNPLLVDCLPIYFSSHDC